MTVLLGLDVGTSGVKAVLTDAAGRRLDERSARYPTSTSGQGAEQDATDWWRAVVEILPGLLDGHRVDAVAVTSQAPTLVPVDARGRPTAPALTWLDRRAAEEGTRLAEVVPGSRNGADPFFGTAKLAWLAAHRPQVLRDSAAILSANGFIVRRLTGRAVLDDSTASLMQGFDEETGGFDRRLRQELPALELLPEIVASTDVVGEVDEEAAAETGLAAGTPVAAGGIDAIGSALEAGALAPGDPLVEMTGFSSVTMLTVPRGTRVPGLIHARHCFADADLLITAQVTAGAAVDWVNGLDPATDLRDDATLLARPRPGRVMMVPSLAGERTPSWNARARGMIDGVDLAADATDLLLAALEGNALALAEDLELMERSGYPVDHVLSTGGGASSRAWLQIKADVLGRPVHKPAGGHGAAQGAAALAGWSIGVTSRREELRGLGGAIETVHRPDAERHRQYEQARPRFARLAELARAR